MSRRDPDGFTRGRTHINLDAVNRELWRRQQGFGRGGRMKIETDRAELVSGVRHSHTIGSPIAIIIRNADWKNWTEALPVEDVDGGEDKRSRLPGRARDTPISRAPSSTTSRTHVTSWSAPVHARPRRGSL